MHNSSLDRVALSDNLAIYMTTLRAANENKNTEMKLSHKNINFPTTKVNDNDKNLYFQKLNFTT